MERKIILRRVNRDGSLSNTINRESLLTFEERRKRRKERPNDSRDVWEIDLSRLIHSAGYRRLQAKTQVLGLGESDFYRTRLTHSMEVAQISSGIVKHLHKQAGRREYRVLLPNRDLIMAIGLAHDLGHPPFGHGGETALNYCMQDYGGFEGNAQTLRILGKLEKYDKGFGINPTRRLLLGILKYPCFYEDVVNVDKYKSDHTDKDVPHWFFKSKLQGPPKCIYKDDKDIFDFIIEPFSHNDRKLFQKLQTKEKNKHQRTHYKSLDTSIMELADDISYSVHDLEDAIALKMITERDWRDYFTGEKEGERFKVVDICKDGISFNYDFEALTNDLFGDSYQRKKAIGSLVHAFIANTYLDDLNNSEEINFEHPLLRYNVKLKEKYKEMRSQICNLVVQKVIKHPNVQQLEFKGQKMVVELFDFFSSDPERFLPDEFKKKWEEADSSRDEKRVIADYISGMTDNFATRTYQKIFVPDSGSIFDRI